MLRKRKRDEYWNYHFIKATGSLDMYRVENEGKRKKSTIILCIILSVIFFLGGIGALVGSYFTRVRADDFMNNGIKIDATIVSIVTSGLGEDEHSNAFVTYEVNGIIYKTELDRYSDEMQEGQTIPIRYMPDNPNKIAYGKNEYFESWMFIMASAICIAVSVIMIIIAVAIKNNKIKLQSEIDSFF